MIALPQRDMIAVLNANIGRIQLIPATSRRYPEIIVQQSSGTGIRQYNPWIPSLFIFYFHFYILHLILQFSSAWLLVTGLSMHFYDPMDDKKFSLFYFPWTLRIWESRFPFFNFVLQVGQFTYLWGSMLNPPLDFGA